MVEYEIEGIKIHFPYEAYPCQLKYMKHVIECLNKGSNGALESPTGTGKTLCLLCSCLAWQQNRKRIVLEQATSQHFTYDSPAMAPSTGTKTNQCITYPRILYTSRTHMQLSQVIRELNKTAYKTVKTCLLGSRDQLCINEDVKREENSTIKNHICRAKVKARSCFYYNGYDAYQNSTKTVDRMENVGSTAFDMEDFISFGRRNKICPFFGSRDKADEADLILMPYNYVVDAKARKANKVDLCNAILIFDEAHNLGKVCEESASITLTTKDASGSLREAKEALNMLLLDEEALRREMDETTAAFGATSKEDATKVDIDSKELGNLILLLEALEKELDKVRLKAGNDRSVTLTGDYILHVLECSGIHAYLRDDISALVDKLTSYLTSKAVNTVWQSRGVALQKLASFLDTIYSDDGDAANETDYREHCRNFKVYVCAIEKENCDDPSLVNSSNRRPGFEFNYWCFNAALTMRSLLEKGIHSVLVTSGTLSPLEQFTSELGIPFHVKMVNEHVVQKNQSWFGVLCQGPDGCTLDSSFANRQNDTYVNSLGNTLVNAFRLVPEGCLVFFASYAQMSSCLERWRTCDIWIRMAKHKALYVEPRSKDEFHRTINEYNTVVKTKSAAFLAVCRGKISEGIDFSDCAARAVIVMGIPYPPAMDPWVVLKKDFLGNQHSRSDSCGRSSKLDGESWYRAEATKAINQAMGRVIRHKDDFGAVILADQRFASWNRDRFPSWIVPNYCAYNKFGEFTKSLAQFFKDKTPKKESLAVCPKSESGFEKNPSLREVVKDRSRDPTVSVMPKRLKSETNLVSSTTMGYIDVYSSPLESLKTKPEPTKTDREKGRNENLWEALAKGSQIKAEQYAPFVSTVQPYVAPVKDQSKRRKIKIVKRETSEDLADWQTAETSAKSLNEEDGLSRREKDKEKSKEYILVAKQNMDRADFDTFMKLVKTYRDDQRFEPLFTFLKSLPFAKHEHILKGFIPFVRAQHKTGYMNFLEKAEQK